jgi:tRNA pseudouridine38-40 synthase
LHNYKLTIQYDGTNYSGWQIQNNAPTIQQEITQTLEKILQEKINLIGSGRTDAGVHAFGQAANFRIEQKLDIYKIQHALNSMLSNSISIGEMKEVDENFHSRFDAKKRSYVYFISKSKSPFYNNYSHLLPRFDELDLKQLKSLSQVLCGEHDFTSFARKQTEVENKVCTVFNIHWKNSADRAIFYIEANRFLHGMVRTIIGTLLFAARKELGEEYLKNVLDKKDREAAAEAVPAKGLFLFKVRY